MLALRPSLLRPVAAVLERPILRRPAALVLD
jgi:hypothetical protein